MFALRNVLQRLKNTSHESLPSIANFLANDIALCRKLFTDPSAIAGNPSEVSVSLTKLKTYITTLLQSKSTGARWTAVVLIKSIVEFQDVKILQESGLWIRLMLGQLMKPAEPTLKQVTVLTLTRIFCLTEGKAALTREITTPSLSTYITACISSVSKKTEVRSVTLIDGRSPLLPYVLQSFIKLLPAHTSTFRPFVKQLRQCLGQIALQSSSNSIDTKFEDGPRISNVSRSQALDLYALLPLCATKDGAPEEWTSGFNEIAQLLHQGCEKVLRPVIEFQKHSPPSAGQVATNLSAFISPENDIRQDIQNLEELFEFLQAYVSTASRLPYSLCIAKVIPTCYRILAVPLSTSDDKNKKPRQKVNHEIPREERDQLYTALPELHHLALRTVLLVLIRVQYIGCSVHSEVLQQLAWTIEHDAEYPRTRHLCYRITEHIVTISGASMSKESMTSVAAIFRKAVLEIIPVVSSESIPSLTKTSDKSNSAAHMAQADAIMAGPLGKAAAESKDYSPGANVASSGLRNAALALISAALTHLPAYGMPLSLRILLDRTAILSGHQDALVASVLNHSATSSQSSRRTKSSILPFLARSAPDSQTVEAIVRPRLPNVSIREASTTKGTDQDDHENPHEDILMLYSLPENPNGVVHRDSIEPSQPPEGNPSANDTPGVRSKAPDAEPPMLSATKRPFANLIEPFAQDISPIINGPATSSLAPQEGSAKTPPIDQEVSEPAAKKSRIKADFQLSDAILPSGSKTVNSQLQSANELRPDLSSTATRSKDVNDEDSDGSEIPSLFIGSDSEQEGLLGDRRWESDGGDSDDSAAEER